MKKSILLLLGIIVFISCKKHEEDELCDYKPEIMAPEGFEINTIGEIDFDGSVEGFQFINEQIGFAMMDKNYGGYVEVLKTTDGGHTWSNMNIGIKQYPKSMVFRDENVGIITVHDVTGCPPPNCLNKCVILKTENGGLDWKEEEFKALKGFLYQPQYDIEGNLYAKLYLDGQYALMKSIDNGEHWDTLFNSPDLGIGGVTYSFQVFKGKIFIPAKEGKIRVLDTNGQLIKTMEINDSPIWDVEVIDENNLVVVGSGKVLKTTNGGGTWETIYEQSAKMIGFDSVDKGLMLLGKGWCPTTDVLQGNDLIASTNDGGFTWTEAKETTTNLRDSYVNSQKMGGGIWYIMLRNRLIEIKEK